MAEQSDNGEGSRLASDGAMFVERFPTSVHQFLDDDRSFDELYEEDLDELAIQLYCEVLSRPPKARLAYAEECRRRAATGDGMDAILSGWLAEASDDDALAARVRDALPPNVREEREAFQHRYRSRLSVQSNDVWWRCDSCGTSFDAGEERALLVVDAEREEQRFCPACIRGVTSHLLASG